MFGIKKSCELLLGSDYYSYTLTANESLIKRSKFSRKFRVQMVPKTIKIRSQLVITDRKNLVDREESKSEKTSPKACYKKCSEIQMRN